MIKEFKADCEDCGSMSGSLHFPGCAKLSEGIKEDKFTDCTGQDERHQLIVFEDTGEGCPLCNALGRIEAIICDMGEGN